MLCIHMNVWLQLVENIESIAIVTWVHFYSHEMSIVFFRDHYPKNKRKLLNLEMIVNSRV